MPILGLHPFGSKIANDYWGSLGEPIKSIDIECINHIVNRLVDDYNIVIFGTKEELDSIKFSVNTDLVTLTYTTIADSFALVSQCKGVIATDSAIKTMASVLKIPSYVYIGAYSDPYRDHGPFLKPYVQDSIMEVTAYIKQTPMMFDKAINELLECSTSY
jgi:ADP-heptose:LPS heptosyltransferase